MKVSEFDLEQLQNIKVPEATPASREHTLQAALSEFDKEQNKQKHFHFSNLFPEWSSISDNLWRLFNPQIAGAAAAILLVSLGTIIYYPEIAEKGDTLEQSPASVKQDKTVNEIAEDREAAPVIQEKPKQKKLQSVPARPSGHIGIGNSNIINTSPLKEQAIPPSGLVNSDAKVKRRYFHRREKSQEKSNSDIIHPSNTFTSPLYKGLPLHYCLLKDEQCGQAVADRFCEIRSLGKSSTFQLENTTPSETISIKDGTVFRQTDNIILKTFKSISCFPYKKNTR